MPAFLAYLVKPIAFAEAGGRVLLPGLGGGTDLRSNYWLESHTLQGFGGTVTFPSKPAHKSSFSETSLGGAACRQDIFSAESAVA